MRRIALRVAYDGTDFRGFTPNPDIRTVAGELQRALEQIVQYQPPLTCAGRTDAGVHARGQVVTFDLDPALTNVDRLEPWRIRHSLNSLCDEDISIDDVWWVSDDFDARHSATLRTYRYTVENRRFRDPLNRGQVWHMYRDADVDAMNEAAKLFLGPHDFSAFCRRKFIITLEGDQIEATRFRNVRSAEWRRDEVDPGLLRFWISASAFCQQMVRSITGTLIDIGTGDLSIDDLPAIMESGDRNVAGKVAPPEGLLFWSVTYGDHPSEEGRPGAV